jgi:hypothetical protein
MSLDNFIPTLWSNELIVSLKKALVFCQPGIINRNYEGEIRSAGDSVKINSIGSVTIGDYVKNTDISAPQELQDAESWFTITRQKFFNFQVDDVDAAQGKPDVMGQAMSEAAYALANLADSYVAGLMDAATSTANSLGSYGTPKTISAATDGYNMLVDAQVLLASANVPNDRFAIVPPWYYALMLKDNRFVQTPSNPSVMNAISSGQIGQVAGLTIIQSNNCVNASGNYTIQLGHSMATTYADQIVEVEAYSPEKRFADAIKGLQVYDAKVIRPEALAKIVVTKA